MWLQEKQADHVLTNVKYYFSSLDSRFGTKNYDGIGVAQYYAKSAQITFKAMEDMISSLDLGGTFENKLKYSTTDIENYYKQYGYNYAYNDMSKFDENKKKQETVWWLVLASKNNYDNDADGYKGLLAYDKGLKIRQFLAKKFNNSQELSKWMMENDKHKTIAVEWANFLNKKEHTEFYNNHKSQIESNYGEFNETNNVDSSKIYSAVATLSRQLRNDQDKASKEIPDIVRDIIKDEAVNVSGEDDEEVNKKKDEKMEDPKIDPDIDTTFYMANNLTSESKSGPSDLVNDAESFVDGSDSENYLKTENLQDFSQKLYSILLGIGIVLSVIIGLILGIKFMLASVAEKAQAKKLLVTYAIGCAVIFGAFGIWKLVVEIMQNI